MDELDVAGIGADGLQQFTPSSLSGLWLELTVAVARDWPGRASSINDSAILRRLEEIASRLPGQSPAIRRQVIDDAPGVLLLAFKNFDRSRPFTPWARRVLANHSISLHRRLSRMRLDSASLHTLEVLAEPLTEDGLEEVLISFRQLLDIVRFPRPTANGPELAAVFALETRLRLLAALPDRGPEFLDGHLPLRRWEQTLPVQRGWPALAELWCELAALTEPGLSDIDSIRRACHRLTPALAVEGLNKVWNTWVHRAKDVVRRQLESNAQAQLFFYLFPNHRVTEPAPGLELQVAR